MFKPIQYGDMFTRLIVSRKIAHTKYKNMWLCICICGNEKEVRGNHLTGGTVKSCGCLNREKRQLNAAKLNEGTDNRTKHPLFWIWVNMMARCYNKNATHYIDYGGRGIKVCDRWHNFWSFVDDMSPRPSPELTLERIDNDREYSWFNCRWATRKEQSANRRRSH